MLRGKNFCGGKLSGLIRLFDLTAISKKNHFWEYGQRITFPPWWNENTNANANRVKHKFGEFVFSEVSWSMKSVELGPGLCLSALEAIHK